MVLIKVMRHMPGGPGAEKFEMSFTHNAGECWELHDQCLWPYFLHELTFFEMAEPPGSRTHLERNTPTISPAKCRMSKKENASKDIF
ncbi:unnamed protein product [Ilex paraguariensis]|uniref:Uncharacterized protein n=1 Tax=Ilex paraguariensis TaxID=185542 RepID=A0ABC8TFE1_9AQUA